MSQTPTRAQWIDSFTMALGRFAVECEPESLAAVATKRYGSMKDFDPEEAAAAEYFEWSPHDMESSRLPQAK
jgi:hypothetical protein